jgi:outer membrane receptor protein involved in Fe transport
VEVLKKYLILLGIITLVFNSVSLAQGRGKITGKVTDKTTGETVIGANIIIKGTNYGAASDVNGIFYIIGVPVGEYELRASFIGYHTLTVQHVRVRTDLTTEVDMVLESSAIETPTVVVTAESKLVQRDITSTRKTFTDDVMQNMPGFESSTDIFRLQGGTVLGSSSSIQMGDGTQLQVRDESVKDVHVRGGRGGEILFMVDGVPVNHPIYGGRDVLDLNVVAVEQVELLTGAFSAEYGQAQSGVVNITTKSGGEVTKAGVEYKTDQLGLWGEDYRTHYGALYLSGPEPVSRYLLPQLGITVPGELSYFISMNANLSNTAYNNNRKRDDFSLFGINVPGRQDNSRNLNGKLNWNVNPAFTAVASFNGSWKAWSSFEWDWLYNPDHMATSKRDNLNANLLLNHVLSKNTFYSLNFGYLGIKYNSSLDGITPDKFWVISPDSVYSTVQAPQSDPLTGFIDSKSYQTIWRDDDTKTFTTKFDFTSMFHPEHLLKTGFELQFHDISYVDIQDGGVKLSPYGEYVYRGGFYTAPPPGPFKEFGQNRWVFDVRPIVGGAYIQEKFEKEFIVINAGLRADFFYLGKTIDNQDWRNQWTLATGLESDWKLTKLKLSPRFGISFPILEQTVIFFSYGHFAQLPELQYFYRDPYTGGFTGNPKLDYEQTILYEFGFTHQIFDDLAIDIKSYAKDISKQVGTTQLLSASGLPVSLYDNIGYARARGLEFELTKSYSNYTNGKITYTVQWANGYSSSAFDDYIRSTNDFPNPIRERRLSWDVRHQVILQASLSSPENDAPISIFGFELPKDWNITVLSTVASGSPYTPYSLDPAVQQVTENTSTGPLSTTTDLKIIKSFDLLGTKFSLTMDVFNLFNQNNVNVDNPYYRWFNTYTGEPYRYGDNIPLTNQYYDWYSMYKLRDPRAYSTGRYVKLGFRWDI